MQTYWDKCSISRVSVVTVNKDRKTGLERNTRQDRIHHFLPLLIILLGNAKTLLIMQITHAGMIDRRTSSKLSIDNIPPYLFVSFFFCRSNNRTRVRMDDGRTAGISLCYLFIRMISQAMATGKAAIPFSLASKASRAATKLDALNRKSVNADDDDDDADDDDDDDEEEYCPAVALLSSQKFGHLSSSQDQGGRRRRTRTNVA